MKKILGGCLIVLVVAAIGFSVAGFYAYRWARPMIESTGSYLDRAREMARLGDRVANRAPYDAPASGELTTLQVERFIAVQARVRDEMGARWQEIEARSAEIRKKTEANHRELSFSELTSVFSDLANIYVEARRVQVNALNIHKFSDAEYSWVRRRVYEAAGMEIAGGIDLSKFEQLARDGAARSDMTMPELPKANVPPANVALVKPHLATLKTSLPMVVLGL